VSHAAAHPHEGTEHLRRYIGALLANASPFYRRTSCWLLLDSMLQHPDAAWTREMAIELSAAALDEPEFHFQEALPITILALRARSGAPGAREELEQRLRTALLETRAPAGDAHLDRWSHRRRRLAALAQSYALAVGDLNAAVEAIAQARALPHGFAAFEA